MSAGTSHLSGTPTTGADSNLRSGDPSSRLMSLDALRGFDMFWIVGGAGIVRVLEKFTGSSVLGGIRAQLSHVEWAGFRFYDLIFPLFVFIAGVSLVFSTRKSVERHGQLGAVRRLLIRGFLLFLIGVFYSGGMSAGLDEIRWLGVLNRIAIASTVAGLLVIFLTVRTLAAVTAGILLGYWGLMQFVSFPALRLEKGAIAEEIARTGKTNLHQLYRSTSSRVSGRYDPGYNLANHLDFQYLPGRKYDTYYDPEGLLSNLPAVATCLLGVLAGFLITCTSIPAARRTLLLMAAGVGCLTVGYLWSFQFPIIKKIWSSSFVLFAGGWSFLLLAVFFQIVDVWRYRFWCRPFVWIGTNAITIYLMSSFVGYPKVFGRFLSPELKSQMGVSGEILMAVGGLLVLFLFARSLYRRNLFLRL